MKTTLIILGILLVLFICSQLYFIMASTETQPYRIIKTEENFEIRVYPPAIMATVSMNAQSYKELSSSGFKKLASFIFGGNASKENIAMTTPVHMDIRDSQSSMSFVMPANYTKENLPKPNDSAISISTSPEEYVAAISFSGFADDEKIKLNALKLENALKEKGIAYSGNFKFLGYNAPYQLVGRKNEIIVNVDWTKE